MSWTSKVIWSEGLFLQPQHFQQQDRYIEHLIEARTAPTSGCPWGFVQLTLDEAALGLGKIAIARARGLFPDGTPVDCPGADVLPGPLDLPADMKDDLVVLAAPLRRAGIIEADAGTPKDRGRARYVTTDIEISDSNAGSERSALVQIGQLRLALMLQRDVTDAYATLGVARVVERRPNNELVLDRGYIAPMLASGNHAVLAGFIREIHGLLHQRGEALAGRVSQPGRGGVAEVADFLLLQTVNRFEPVFAHFARVSMLHPERLFAACLLLGGDLATFARETRRPIEYVPYLHDHLDQCFAPLMNDLRRSLSMVLEQNAVPIELQDRKYGVRVAIIPDAELMRSASFILAVSAHMPGDALRLRFPSQVKIGPVERIRDLVNLALPGIALRSCAVAPRQLPYHAGFNYFELERGGELWKQLERGGGLALHVAGEFPGLELEFWAIRN